MRWGRFPSLVSLEVAVAGVSESICMCHNTTTKGLQMRREPRLEKDLP